MSETQPLLPHPVNATQNDSHPIYLRATHSPWPLINQRLLVVLRFTFAGYLIAVFGVSFKYKLETKDDHNGWRIPFQFSTVSLVLLMLWNILAFVWTSMHLMFPRGPGDDDEHCAGHCWTNRMIRFFSPPATATCPNRRFAFSLFYTTAHVFAFMNTLVYWAVLVPAGHGGFRAPNWPHEHQPENDGTVLYDPDKGLFEEEPIKAFSILNIWTITSVIALIEIIFLNSIRRQTPVASHVAGIMFNSGVYLAWAGLGKLLTGHAGLFFIDPDLMGKLNEAPIFACLAFITIAPGIFSYMYGLIAMRETITAAHHDY